jgi:hypothetical protein
VYKGGPNSFNGIGKTVIRRPYDTMTTVSRPSEANRKLLNSFVPMSLQQTLRISEEGTIFESNHNEDQLSYTNNEFDFRKKDFREFKTSTILPVVKSFPFLIMKNRIWKTVFV